MSIENPQKQTILLVDDEPEVLDMLEANLGVAGYDVLKTGNGLDAFVEIQSKSIHLAIIDVELPDINGLLLCKKIRTESKKKDLPVLILTGKSDEETQVDALEAGADDIIVKSTSARIVIGHVRAILRRAAGFRVAEEDKALEVEDLTIDREKYVVIKKEGDTKRRIHFPRKEFELLYLLANNRGRVFTRDELLDTVWGTDIYVTPRTVDVHVRKVRNKISSEYIETVTGVGYRFKEA